MGAQKADRKKIFQIMWSPTQPNTFMSVGVEHIFCWTAPNLSKKRASNMPQSKPGQKLGFPSLAFTRSGLALIAGSDGAVYGFQGGARSKVFKGVHAKMVSCITSVPDPSNSGNEIVITGGADKKIICHVLDSAKNLNKVFEFTVDSTPRSVDFMGDQILTGLSNGSILEFKGVITNPSQP